MRKAFVALVIAVLSICMAFLYEALADAVLKSTHPVKYEELVEKYSEQYMVPKEIVYAVIKCESSFESDAMSHKGAVGLMQITPDTYSWLVSKIGGDANPALLYEPETNIAYGTYFLSILYSEFNSWDNVFAAYNAGRTRVKEWLADEKYSEYGVLKNIPYKETRKYIKRVNNAAETYKRLYFKK